MNSNDENFDWHRRGVWVAHDAGGTPYPDTMNTTPHSSRSRLLGLYSGSDWASLRDSGWVIQEYVPAVAADSAVKVGEDVTTAAVSFWRYPAAGQAAPAGSTVWLLTRGGVSVRGIWNDLGDYIAWAPMLQRDKELEARLGL